MNKQKIRSGSSLLAGLFFIFLGILFFFRYTHIYNLLYVLFIIGLCWIGFNHLLQTFINKKNRLNIAAVLTSLLVLSLAAILVIYPSVFHRFVHYLVGWWALINAVIQFINFYVYRQDCLKGTAYQFFKGLVNLIFGMILIINPFDKIWMIAAIAGVYFIFYGVSTFFEALKDMISASTRIKVTNHLRLSVPVLFSAIIPQRFFLSINALIKTNKLVPENPAVAPKDTHLEVFLYLKESGPESLGHCDISYNGKIYSYGCHDPHNRCLMGTLGDGVLIVSDRDSFLKHALRTEDKTIIGYGLTLTDRQNEILQKRIDDMMARTVLWKPDGQLLAEGDSSITEAKDYASRVWSSTKAQMYKFTQGKFKTYFVFSTNCVLLADELLHYKELELIPIGGIVTPGSYLEFLNREYCRPYSMVTQRTIYKRTSGKSGSYTDGSSFAGKQK